MQDAWIWHAVAALLVHRASRSATSTSARIGLEGSYQAMRTGYVDETWAKEHHEYWYDEMKSGKRAAAAGGAVPAGAPHTKEKIMKAHPRRTRRAD